jgi:O-acetyl-ADP-ribose deacetylase (regulator of RNase III)
MTMTVKLTSGDLLQQDVDAIVNTVNTVGVMGKGIALQFKQKWPENFRAYERACKRDEVQLGKMFIYDAGGLLKPRYIINFPTKRHWREKSRLEDIEMGLKDLVLRVKSLGIRSIALPPLGCGNGGLNWDDVRPRIERALAGLPNVDVKLFSPTGAPAPQAQEIRTAKPKLTAVRAAMIKLLAAYRALDYALTRIEVQKLAYFLEEAGEPLQMKFEANNYGPYSNTLEHVLKALDGHYLLGVGDRTGPGEIQVAPDAVEEADSYLSEALQSETAERVSRVTDLIAGYETPYGMELLGTVHWVATHPPWASNVDEAVKAVHAWNRRKQQLMSDEHIRLAWERMAGQNWLGLRERPESHNS